MDRPQNLEVVRGLASVAVSGSTLPWSFVEIVHSSQDGEGDFTLQADGNGDFSETVPLAEGINIVEIVSRHGASAQQVRQFLQLTYAPTPLTLSLTITEPRDGATVASAVQTVVGAVRPDAQVILNGIIPAHLDETGRWHADIVLQPGPNQIQVTASRGEERSQTTITVTYDPG